MTVAPFIFAATSLISLSQAAPLTSRLTRSLLARDETPYRPFGGDGTMAQGWPAVSDWTDFDTMWEANKAVMGQCLDGLAPNSDAETEAIKTGIEQAAKDADMDHRFLLAVIMQESGGCVRVGTTYSPPPDNIRNPGLMQDFNGKHTCNDPKSGTEIKNPCPDEDIIGMITDGAGVTNDGGMKQAIEKSGASDDSKYYKAARIYNSGSIASSGNLGEGVATHCYASDIANRLTGWLGIVRTCDENTIGTAQSPASSGSPSAVVSSATVPSGTPVVSSLVTPTLIPTSAPFSNGTTTVVIPSGTGLPPLSTGAIATPTTVSTATGSGSITAQPVGPKGQGAVEGCTSWYTVKAGDNCGSIETFYGLPTGTLKSLNTGLDAQCTNLEAGSSYCVRNV